MLGSVSYELIDSLLARANLSYDEAFETRVSGNIEYRFGTGNATQVEKKTWQIPVIQSLTESVKHRDVRVHDAFVGGWICFSKPSQTKGHVTRYGQEYIYHCNPKDRPLKMNIWTTPASLNPTNPYTYGS